MHEYALSHLSDTALLRELSQLVRQDRATTARLIAHLAEVDARRLYAPAGHPSMFAYCVEELRFSEDCAYKRIRAARAARQFPALFAALADGRLHLAAVTLLAPHMTSENVGELIDAATHRSKNEVEGWVARRFGVGAATKTPPAVIRPLVQLAPGRVVSALGDLLAGTVSAAGDALSARLGANEPSDPSSSCSGACQGTAVQPGESGSLDAAKTASSGDQLAPGRVAPPLEPPLEERYSMHLTIPKSMHDKIRRAQCLLSHAIPSGDVAKVLERALDLMLAYEERRISSARPATTKSSRPGRVPSKVPASSRGRYIPPRVRRAVWERDQGQCTFVTLAGHRCSARRFLEIDHVEPVARGGRSTVEGLRLRCRAHNQYTAEQTFGTEFMNQKREQARRERAVRRELVHREPVEPGLGANDQPDKVREPSGSWCVTRPEATRPGASSRPERRGGRLDYLAYARPTISVRPGAG